MTYQILNPSFAALYPDEALDSCCDVLSVVERVLMIDTAGNAEPLTVREKEGLVFLLKGVASTLHVVSKSEDRNEIQALEKAA